MGINIALVGNPNSGKTTMFNILTGSSQYVGNWPGVTVEKKSGKLKGYKDVNIVDLPGIYSLSPYTLEEVISRDYLLTERPDAIINIVDSTNVERNLYLTTQLLEIDIPVIIALNMTDALARKGDKIDALALSNEIGCEVIETSALKGKGCFESARKAVQIAEAGMKPSKLTRFSETTEIALIEVENIIEKGVDKRILRWYAIKLIERDEKVWNNINISPSDKESVKAIIAKYEGIVGDDGESAIINDRYCYISEIAKQFVVKSNKESVSSKIDCIVMNRVFALPIFAIIMFLVYYLSISTLGGLGSGWVNDTLFAEIITPGVESFLNNVGAADWLNSLILSGIIGGVGAVLGFLPQILVLFFCLAILEDCGYMVRIAFILDRVFRKFGLSGKSFIPILIGTGCGVPGIMASRTIEDERDRKMTIITTTFIPCGAKLPIIALISGALFSGSAWIVPLAYFSGIGAIVVSGVILKKTRAFAGESSPFVMELPPYHLPDLKSALRQTWDRGKSFVQKAGTVIFLACGITWFLSSFNWSMEMADTADSILASIGKVFAPLFSPLGWGHWEATVATVTGLAAKENIVGTLGVLYGFSDAAKGGAETWANLQTAFTQLSAFSFLIFNLLCAPCFAAIGAIRREMGSMKWTLIAVSYQTLFSYIVAMIIYQIGMLFAGGFNGFTVIAIILVLWLIYMLFRPQDKSYGHQNKPIIKA